MKKLKDSQPTIPCPHCGTDNRLGNPFCVTCGKRIYEGTGAPPKVKVKTKGGMKRAVRNAVLALIALVIVGSASLMFWPFPALRQANLSGSDASVRSFLATATRSLDSNQVIPVTRIEEGQWNRYGLNQFPDSGSRSLNLYTTSQKLILVADEKTGPFQISTRVVMAREGEEKHLSVKSLWVGHLPLPAFMATAWTKSLALRYELDLDDRLWKQLRIYAAEPGAFYVGNSP
jgi:hypothetical protein